MRENLHYHCNALINKVFFIYCRHAALAKALNKAKQPAEVIRLWEEAESPGIVNEVFATEYLKSLVYSNRINAFSSSEAIQRYLHPVFSLEKRMRFLGKTLKHHDQTQQALTIVQDCNVFDGVNTLENDKNLLQQHVKFPPAYQIF